MVVRLKDLNSDKRDEESRNRPVRLSDLRRQNDIDPGLANEIRLAPLKLSQGLQRRVEESKVVKAAADEEYQRQYEQMPKYRQVAADIVNSPIGKRLFKANEASSDFIRGALDTASLGAIRPLDEAISSSPLLNQREQERMQEDIERSRESTAGKVGEFAGYLVPGAAADRLAFSLGKTAIQGLPKIARGAIRGVSAGAIDSAAQEVGDVAFREGEFNPLNIAIGAGAGGALGAAAPAIGQAFQRFVSRSKSVAPELEQATRTALETAQPTKALGTLRPLNKDQYVSRIMGQIKDDVNQRMTPPLENPNELAKWLKPHLGDVSLNEIRKLSFDDMTQLANEVRNNMSTYDVARQVARERGIDLDEAFSGNIPSVRQAVAQDASRRAYGIYDAPKVNISRPVRPLGPELPRETPQIRNAEVVEGPIRLSDLRATPQQVEQAVVPSGKSPKTTSQRGFTQTLINSGKTSNDIAEALGMSPNRKYQVKTNVDTVATANKRIRKGIDEAEATLLGKRKFTAEDVATGMRLIDEFQKSGNTQRAVTVAERLAKQLTEAGQTVQAASIWNRLTPEGALLAAQRRVNTINENLLRGQNPVKITPQQADSITDAATAIQASGASQERAGTVMQIMDRVRKGETISAEDRQTIADFVEDAKRFLAPEKPPRAPKVPKELNEPRVRDKVVSFFETQEQAARERIRARRNTLSSTPFDTWGDYAIIGASKIAKGVRDFADWSEQMAKDLGEEIRPYLQSIFEKSQDAIRRTSGNISRGKIDRAENAINKLVQNKSPKSQTNEQVSELANVVRSAIAKSKDGTLSVDDVNRIRELSQETVEALGEPKPMTEEQRYLKSIRQLARKLATSEDAVEPPQQFKSVKEVETLLRQVSNIANEGVESTPLAIDKESLERLAFELFDRAKPSQAEKAANSYLKKNADKLSPEDISMVRELAQEVSRLSGKERQAAAQDLQAILNGFEKAGIGRKLSSLQYISMLLNPKTQIRNIVGNELLYRLERLSKYIGTPIDIVTSKLTGGKRTVTFKRGPMVWDDFFKSTKDYWTALPEGAKAGARGVSPEGLTTKYEIQGRAFRSKYNPLTYLEKALGASLQGFDYAAYTRATNQRLSEMAYLDAINSGIKGTNNIRSHMQTFMANMDDAVHTIAKDYGKYATLQDDSLLAKKLMGFRRGMNKVSTFGGSENFGIGSIVVPFAKTPANLLLRGLDYSPAGILKAVKQVYDILRVKNTDLTRADVISSVSRAIMGSGMGAVAYWLADKGAMFGQSNKDSETRKLQQMAGIRDFQINGSAVLRMLEAAATGGDVDAAAKLKDGDTLWAYEWAQPSSMPMAIGSNIHQSVKQSQGPLQTTSEAALSGFSTLFNSSVLSGIREAFQIPMGEDNAVKAIGMNLVKQAPSMFTPSIVRNINTFLDDKLRETYTPDDALKIVNPARSGIPGQAQQMPQRVDTFGRPMTRPNSFFDVFVSPSDRSKYEPTPEAQFVLDLLNETGNTNVAPRAVPKYLTGKDIKTGLNRKVDLTPEQYVRLQTIVGEETAKRIMKINPNLSTDKKVERVLKAMDEAGKIGRNQLKKELGLRLTK